MDAETKRKLIVAGVAGGLSAVAVTTGFLNNVTGIVGGGLAAATAVTVFMSVVITEYLTDVLVK